MADLVIREAVSQTDPTFVGRAAELRLFRTAFDGMLDGRLQLLTLLGEPGIGKTRCAEAFGRVAEDQGALVLWGRCYEEPGAPAYWPWVQVLREYIRGSSATDVQLLMGSGVADIATILPELGERSDDSLPAPAAVFNGNQPRFRAFDAIAQFLAKCARRVPLVLILDNLHWADASSLSLLEFLSHELKRERVLIIGTYRDNEVSRKSPLLSALGGLSRESAMQRIRLPGLPEEEIGELAGQTLGTALPLAAIHAINQQTDGNPLFVIELLRVLMEESADAGVAPIAVRIPDGVREAIGRRLSRLSERCNDLLIVASVLGRNFSAAEVASAAESELETVLDNLQIAARAGIVEPFGDTPAGYRFTHTLIRETLYDEIPGLDRLRWHSRAADALVEIHGAALDSVLTRVAHHYYQSAPLGNADKAADFGSRAASIALRAHAYEQAIVHCDQVIGALEQACKHNDERSAKAWFMKGSALLWMGDAARCVEVSYHALNRAKAVGDVALLVDVVTQLVLVTSQVPQTQHVRLLERVLSLLPAHEGAARAQTLAALAFALRSGGDHERIQPLLAEALETARQLDDPAVLCRCFDFAILALRSKPETLDQRVRMGTEHLQVAQRVATEYLAKACSWQAMNLMEAGRADECDALLDRYETLNVQHLGFHEYYVLTHRIALALLRGEWDGLDERVEHLLAIGMKTRPDDAEGVYGAQMFALNRDRGRLKALGPLVQQFIEGGTRRAWAPGLMLACAEIGFLDEARCQFERLAEDDFATIAKDDMYVTTLVFCAETCCVLDDARRAKDLYTRLLPYAEQVANHPRAVCFGATALFLAMLTATMRRPEEAKQHFEAALSRNRSIQAWPWLARTQYRYGAFLLTLDGADNRHTGRALLGEAEQLAGGLRMEGLLEDIGQLLRGVDHRHAFPDGLTAREIEVLQLMTMGRSNKDISAALTISLNTVASHVRNILNKTQCANRTEAAAYAMRHQLQTPSGAPQ